jgi:hypothetical protein
LAVLASLVVDILGHLIQDNNLAELMMNLLVASMWQVLFLLVEWPQVSELWAVDNEDHLILDNSLVVLVSLVLDILDLVIPGNNLAAQASLAELPLVFEFLVVDILDRLILDSNLAALVS